MSRATTKSSLAEGRDSPRLLLLQIAFAVIGVVGTAAAFAGAGIYAYALVPVAVWLGALIGQELDDSRSKAEERRMKLTEKLVAAPIVTGSAIAVVAATIGSVLLS